MTINFQKTAILLKLIRRDATRIKHEATYKQGGITYLRVAVHGRECGIPIKVDHEYLGSIVSYHRRIEKNTADRIRACQARHQGLRKTLNGSHHLSQGHRIRLWQACLCTSAFYSLPMVGLTHASLHKLTSVLTKHLRAILRLPAHLTHVATATVWARAGLEQPGPLLKASLLRFSARLQAKHNSAPDITTAPDTLRRLEGLERELETALQQEAQHISQGPADANLVQCPRCDASFISENAMRIHCKLQHQHLPAHSTRTPTRFEPHLHAVSGMPQCRLCTRQFFRWSHLRQHIESGACSKLGGDSLVRAPRDSTQDQASVRTPPTAGLAEFEGQNVAHLPLVLREAFVQQLPHWEHWLSVPSVLKELKNHCSLCHQWIADFRHVRQHVHRAHKSTHGHLFEQANEIVKTFKSHLTRDRTCLFCGHKVGAPGRHISQCVPRFQLVLAVLSCREQQPNVGLGNGGPGRPGIGHVRALLQCRPASFPSAAGSSQQAPASRTAFEHAETGLCSESTGAHADVSSGDINTDGARAPPPDEQGNLATRGSYCSPASGEVLCHVHETRAGGHSSTIDDGCQGVERQEEQEPGAVGLTTSNINATINAAGAVEPSAEGSCNGGGPSNLDEAGLAHGRAPLALFALGSQGQATGAGPASTTPALRADETAHLDVEGAQGRDHPDLQIHDAASQGRHPARPHHHLQVGDFPASTGNARGLQQARGERGYPPDRSFHQAGHASANTGSTTVGRPHLSPQVMPDAQNSNPRHSALSPVRTQLPHRLRPYRALACRVARISAT